MWSWCGPGTIWRATEGLRDVHVLRQWEITRLKHAYVGWIKNQWSTIAPKVRIKTNMWQLTQLVLIFLLASSFKSSFAYPLWEPISHLVWVPIPIFLNVPTASSSSEALIKSPGPSKARMLCQPFMMQGWEEANVLFSLPTCCGHCFPRGRRVRVTTSYSKHPKCHIHRDGCYDLSEDELNASLLGPAAPYAYH